MMTDQEALDQLIYDWYGTEEALFESALFDSTSGGICKECGYSTDVEPDSSAGWCEECQAATVVSGMVLAGIY
jgi:hypothetical protein